MAKKIFTGFLVYCFVSCILFSQAPAMELTCKVHRASSGTESSIEYPAKRAEDLIAKTLMALEDESAKEKPSTERIGLLEHILKSLRYWEARDRDFLAETESLILKTVQTFTSDPTPLQCQLLVVLSAAFVIIPIVYIAVVGVDDPRALYYAVTQIALGLSMYLVYVTYCPAPEKQY